MGLIKDISQGPVASTNAITDHLTDNAIAKIQQLAAALAPELNVDATQLTDHITTSLTGALSSAIDETEQAGEKLSVKSINTFFACLWKTRIEGKIEIKGGD